MGAVKATNIEKTTSNRIEKTTGIEMAKGIGKATGIAKTTISLHAKTNETTRTEKAARDAKQFLPNSRSLYGSCQNG